MPNVNSEKYSDIAADLKRQIDSGMMSGKIPGQRQLAEKYSVNVITVRKALDILMNGGIIESVPCKGFFIKRLNSGIQNTQFIGFLLTTQGHLYSDMTYMLTSGFQAKGYFPIVINTLKHQMSDREFQGQLEKIIGTEPAAIIVDGHSEFPYEIFNKNCRHIKNLTVIFRNEHDFTNSLNILPDRIKGGYIGGNHLIKQGCRKIAFLLPDKASFLVRHGAELILKGFEKAAAKHKIDYIPVEADQSSRNLIKFLKDWKPDAVFASADYLLEPVYKYALENRIRIPEDIALLGYYNTPWCNMYPSPLSSISIDLEAMTKCIIDKTLENINGASCTDTIMIDPKLTERISSLKTGVEYATL